MDKAIKLKLNGIAIKVSTNYSDYYRYLESYFKDIIMPEGLDSYQIEIRADWVMDLWGKHPPRIKFEKELNVIGGNTAMTSGRVVTLRKFLRKRKIIFDIKLKGEKLELYAVSHKKIFKDKIYYNILGKSQESYFFEITYPLIYYPLFWYLEYFKGVHILHASAFTLKDKGIVFCGMEGIGKTSLVLSLISHDDLWISDNLIFYDKNRIYPCYELIRLCDGDEGFMRKGKVEKVENFKGAKAFCRPNLGLRNDSAKPNLFIFPEFSANFFTKKISSQQAANMALITSFLPAELGNYSEYCSLFNLLDLNFDIWGGRNQALLALLESIDCYLIGMPKADGLKKNVERIENFLKNA